MNTEKSFIDQCFEKAQREVFTLPSCTDDNKLKIYGLYKQATVGDNNGPTPYAFNFRKKAKWESWEGYRGMSQTVAKREYINLVECLHKETA